MKKINARLWLTLTLTILSAVGDDAGSANAKTNCDVERMTQDFGPNLNLKALEFLLLPTPYRALCGHAIDDDIQFWESMIDYYDCSEESNITESFRNHWTKSIENRRPHYEKFRIENAEEVAEVCRQAGELQYPQHYSLDGLKRFAEQWSRYPALHPK